VHLRLGTGTRSPAKPPRVPTHQTFPYRLDRQQHLFLPVSCHDESAFCSPMVLINGFPRRHFARPKTLIQHLAPRVRISFFVILFRRHSSRSQSHCCLTSKSHRPPFARVFPYDSILPHFSWGNFPPSFRDARSARTGNRDRETRLDRSYSGYIARSRSRYVHPLRVRPQSGSYIVTECTRE
jgi:hypothetical protein